MEVRMTQKKEKIIGIRLTNTEKEEIDVFVQKAGSNLTGFIRQAITFYISNLEENNERINIGNIVNHTKKIRASLNKVKESFNQVKLDLNDLSINFNQLDKELTMVLNKRVVRDTVKSSEFLKERRLQRDL